MTIEAMLISCSRSLLFETDILGARYVLGGSCLFCGYHGSLFAITADHCLDYVASYPETQIDHSVIQNVLIPHCHAGRTFFTYESCFKRRRALKDAPNYTDLAVMKVRAPLEWDAGATEIVSFDGMPSSLCQMAVGEKVILRGYPYAAKNEIHYSAADVDGGKIFRQGVIASGCYLGSDSAAYCHLFHLDKFDEMPNRDANGMSGAAVFRVLDAGTKSAAEFAGVFIGQQRYLENGIFVDRAIVFDRMNELLIEARRKGLNHGTVVQVRNTP
jgi:hypothetical protein